MWALKGNVLILVIFLASCKASPNLHDVPQPLTPTLSSQDVALYKENLALENAKLLEEALQLEKKVAQK